MSPFASQLLLGCLVALAGYLVIHAIRSPHVRQHRNRRTAA